MKLASNVLKGWMKVCPYHRMKLASNVLKGWMKVCPFFIFSLWLIKEKGIKVLPISFITFASYLSTRP